MNNKLSSGQAGRPDILPGDPTISVVVTCYNYGHFVESCLESVYAQSLPPHEIIVVDDGSTDACATLLASHSDRARVIRTANGGQGAAFNRGFAESTGDIVLFLDADDLLDPTAIETVATFWAGDLAALTFGLRTVDGAGRCTGAYGPSIDSDSGDNRPLLLATGTFSFPPTSGNAFSRACLSAVLPMPEPRWKVSADCYLIRASALHGRFAHVPRVLGSYRMHGGNNYAMGLEEHADLARQAENARDVADALWALAETPERFAEEPDTAKALRNALQFRAAAVLRGPNGAASTTPEAQDTQGDLLARPRWPVHLPFDHWLGPDDKGGTRALREVFLPDIRQDGGAHLRSDAVEFFVDPHPDMLALKLHLIVGADAPVGGAYTVRVNGTALWRGDVHGERHVAIALRQSNAAISRRLLIEVAAPGQASIEIRGLEVATRGTVHPSPLLDPQGRQTTVDALGAALDPQEWLVDSTGTATLRGQEGHLRFSVLGGPDVGLLLDFGGWPPRGTLIVSRGGQVLFLGKLGAQRSILVRLPGSGRTTEAHELRLHFDRATLAAPLVIAAIGLHLPGASDAATTPPLNLGETVNFEAGRGQDGFLGSGWDAPVPTGTRNRATEATLAFRPPEGSGDLRIAIELTAVNEPISMVRHVVGVSMEGEMLSALALEGSGTIEMALPDQRRGRDLRLTLHSAYVHDPGAVQYSEAEPSDPTEPTPDMSDVLALLELRSVTLEGHVGPRREAWPMRRAAPRPKPAAQLLLDRTERLLQNEGNRDAEAGVLRAELTALAAQGSRAAVILILSTPGVVDRFTRLGLLTRHVERQPAEQSALDAVGNDAPDDETARLRHALLQILHFPAAFSPLMSGLTDLPAPLFWDVPALAGWLTAPVDIEEKGQHDRYLAFLTLLLTEVDCALAQEPQGSALHRLAVEVIERLRSTRMIFGSGVLRDVIRLRGRAIERLLAQQGALLAAPRLPGEVRGRRRIGVMVRNLAPSPEGWALLGMYGALDPGRFETVLIRLDHPQKGEGAMPGAQDVFADELCLDGLGVAASVDAIRALELDLFLTGAYAGEWEKAGLILAHRLAPMQIWPGAVCPTTTGFRSFDLALSARVTEPTDPQRHYMPPLAWIDGPLQAAYAFEAPASVDRAALRQSLSLAPDRVMLTSGAMAHKITDDLLAAWADILARCPQADLVLYPFAQNWSIPFAEDRFRARIEAQMAKAGVAADRVRLLANQKTDAVRAIVGTADLYLDSFPYTGATTVCEALSCGTPAITLAGDSLRELTGTSWINAFALPDLVAESPSAYVDRAVALATDRETLTALGKDLKKRLCAGSPPHCDTAAFGAAFSDALWRIAEDSGLFPRLHVKPLWTMEPVDALPRPARQSPAIVLHLKPPAKRFAVLTSPRSGSSLFCHMMNATPNVRCHYELFHEKMIEYHGKTVTDPAALAVRDADPVGFLESTFETAFEDGFELVGFKQMGFFSERISEVVTGDPRVRIVVLRRNNLLAKFASLCVAEMTDQWKVGKDQTVRRPRVTFDPERFARFERWETQLSRARNDLLASQRRDVLLLEYSDLRSPETGHRLSDFLGRGLRWEDAVDLQQVNPGSILDRFSNPDAVRSFIELRGKPEWGDAG